MIVSDFVDIVLPLLYVLLGWFLGHFRIQSLFAKLRRGVKAVKSPAGEHGSPDITELIRSREEMRKFYEMQRGSRPWYVFLFLGVLVGTLLVLVADFNTPVPIPYGIISLVGAIYLGINLLVIAWHRLRFRRKFPHHELISNVFADQLKAVAAGHEYVFIPAEVDIPPEKVENIRWALLNYPPTKYLRDDDDDGVSEADRWRQANILARSLNRYKLTTDPRMLDDALIDLLASFKRPGGIGNRGV